jgi:hypothetical protein
MVSEVVMEKEKFPQRISTWMGIVAVSNLLRRTEDFSLCENNPYFELARAHLLDEMMRVPAAHITRKEVRA